MGQKNFRDLLEARWAEGKFVCVGLDSELSKIPECVKTPNVSQTLIAFNKTIVDATKDLVCAYKPNSAFYEAYGTDGLEALKVTIDYIKTNAPGVPVILDAKRADIGNTNAGYVRSAFEQLQSDAITVHPYLGEEALKPFLDNPDKGVIVLCRTSNPGAGEFQDLLVNGVPQYQIVARQVAQKWNKNRNCAVVVGATYPDELLEVRRLVGDLPILIPGVGAQGGDVEKTVTAGRDSRGMGMIINSSRGIIFASKDKNFAEAARNETIKLSEQIRQYLSKPSSHSTSAPSSKTGSISEEEVRNIFSRNHAVITNDHIVYVSKKHGSAYVNKDAVYPDTEDISRLCQGIAAEFVNSGVEVVVGPENGAIILSQWTAYHLTKLTGKKILSVYAEKVEDPSSKEEKFVIKRGYDKLVQGKKILVVEDILNTGGSVKNVIQTVRDIGGNVIGLGVLCNRGNVTSEMVGGVPKLYALLNVTLDAYEPDKCPLCAKGTPINTSVGHGRTFLAELAGKQV